MTDTPSLTLHPAIKRVLDFLQAHFVALFTVRTARDLTWPPAWVFTVLLLPMLYVGAHASPQSYDFCTGRFLHEGFWTGVYDQYNTYGHQFLGRTLGFLPLVLVSEFSLDYFYIYALFIMLGLVSFILFARWMVRQLLPTTPAPLKFLAATVLAVALTADAPKVRELIFSLPGYFTYALPGLLMSVIFICLYRALAATRDFTWPERIMLLTTTPLLALSNEWSGLALMSLLLCAFIVRLRLVPEAPAPILHAILLGLSILGAIMLLLGPQDPIFKLDHMGMGFLWSLLYTPEFFLLRLPMPGVIGWFLLLAVSYRPELRAATLSDRHRQLLSFTLLSLILVSFIAFTFGYLPNEDRLPARGQNELFVVVIVALSVAFCLIMPILRYRFDQTLQRWPVLQNAAQKSPPLLVLALLLSLLSPGVLGALWQMNSVGTFREESRARLALMINRAEPTVYVPPLTAQPSLLFDRDVGSNPNSWRNNCMADFFKVDRVLRQPAENEIGN